MRSIKGNLVLGLLIPLAIVAALVSLETFFSSKRISSQLNDRTLLAASFTILERVIATDGTLLADETLDTLTENLGDRFFYHVSGPNGAFITGYSGYPRPPEVITKNTTEPSFYDAKHLGEVVRVVRLQRDLTERELSGITTITTWQRTEQRAALTLDLFARSLARLVLLVISAVAIVWFAVKWGLKPLTNLQAAIDQRTPYELNPIKRALPSELKGIVGSMNELFARVARSKSNRERFIGDAAHQLKNPIAAIKVQAEAGLLSTDAKTSKSSLEQIVSVADNSTAMINKMLSGASAYTADKSGFAEMNISAMLASVLSNAVISALDKDQQISLTGTETNVLFIGDETLLSEAISNLLDNAIRYSPLGAEIEVALLKRDNELKISIADSGAPFEYVEFDRLSQPFTSGDQDNVGSGLGLSIAKDIAKMHGGHLKIEPAKIGKSISIILPKN